MVVVNQKDAKRDADQFLHVLVSRNTEDKISAWPTDACNAGALQSSIPDDLAVRRVSPRTTTKLGYLEPRNEVFLSLRVSSSASHICISVSLVLMEHSKPLLTDHPYVFFFSWTKVCSAFPQKLMDRALMKHFRIELGGPRDI